ncbi:MAG TPA: hypothetical protein VGR37_02620 [Longimicrobiaceae bacterium]|nr:hypothetical protein [Longimicrobiaceae bacterium]
MAEIQGERSPPAASPVTCALNRCIGALRASVNLLRTPTDHPGRRYSYHRVIWAALAIPLGWLAYAFVLSFL